MYFVYLRNFYIPACFPKYRILIHNIKNTLLTVTQYGCEIMSLSLREEHKFRLSDNKLLRKIFGAKRDEITYLNEYGQ